MQQKQKTDWGTKYMMVVALILFVFVPAYYYTTGEVRGPSTVSTINKALLQEALESIPMMDGASITGKSEFIRYDGSGSMQYSYEIEDDWKSVLRYYDLQLQNRGWRFINSGESSGQRRFRYEKDSYEGKGARAMIITFPIDHQRTWSFHLTATTTK